MAAKLLSLPRDEEFNFGLPCFPDNQAYIAAEQFVKSVKITHDVAKQGVKIASDYANILTRDSKIWQMFFQVEKDRKPWHH